MTQRISPSSQLDISLSIHPSIHPIKALLNQSPTHPPILLVNLPSNQTIGFSRRDGSCHSEQSCRHGIALDAPDFSRLLLRLPLSTSPTFPISCIPAQVFPAPSSLVSALYLHRWRRVSSMLCNVIPVRLDLCCNRDNAR